MQINSSGSHRTAFQIAETYLKNQNEKVITELTNSVYKELVLLSKLGWATLNIEKASKLLDGDIKSIKEGQEILAELRKQNLQRLGG